MAQAAEQRLTDATWFFKERDTASFTRRRAACLTRRASAAEAANLEAAAHQIEAVLDELPDQTAIALLALALSYRRRAAIYAAGA